MRFSRIFIAFLMVVLCSKGFAAEGEKALTNLRGTISDATTGERLAGVAVCIDGLNQTVYTDFDGEFEMRFPCEGKFDISLRLASYKSETIKQLPVVAKSAKSLGFTLRRN